MKILGVSAGFHDAGLTVLDDSEIIFAGHSERFSKKKHDKNLCSEIIDTAFSYGPFDAVGYYERPWLKKTREIYAGQGISGETSSTWTTRGSLKKHFGDNYPKLPYKSYSFDHHLSHTAAGFQTSPYEEATVVVIDAIGEWDTICLLYTSPSPRD